ncbi:uncharacterized protein EKO05_0004043 [Ascochyta rabiei]|uniref:uncharacterized protein n=1 Tax=Didymella rabiei TaxID=5454 RepID=UPI00220BA57E|nr:uncharacterized protein EKO05_0004043 [Ascochyta rabiei]UPX13537.1 hypothetical protein EKO05_0004043 [Ascochyta rabiei]
MVDRGGGARGVSNIGSRWPHTMALHDGGAQLNGSARFGSSGSQFGVTYDDGRTRDGNVSMLGWAKANRGLSGPTCKGKPAVSLFGRNRRQRACWWGARARRQVVVCHVGLVVDGSGHCMMLKPKVGSG